MRVNNLVGLVVCGVALVSTSVAQNQIPTSTSTIEVKKTIPFSFQYEFSRSLKPGQVKTVVEGKDGYVTTTYEVVKKGGKIVSKKALYSKKVEPVNQMMAIGKGGYEVSRSKIEGSKVLTMEASAYDPYPAGSSGSGKTATGIPARFGVAAVDPKVIPLGTLLFIEGYGFALAADTGGAIKGNKIDLCYNSKAECRKFGRRKVKVHILGKG